MTLPWDETNPEWWKSQVQSRGEIAWKWLVNEWAARPGSVCACGHPHILSVGDGEDAGCAAMDRGCECWTFHE